MFNKPIPARATGEELFRVAHSDEVRGNTPTAHLQVRNDVSPQIGGGWIAMQEDDRIARPTFDIGHAQAVDIDAVFLTFPMHPHMIWACRALPATLDHCKPSGR